MGGSNLVTKNNSVVPDFNLEFKEIEYKKLNGKPCDRLVNCI